MDVVEGTKPWVEGEMVIMHDGEVELLSPTSESRAERNGALVMVDEVGSPLEMRSSLPVPQNGEVSQVVETASTEASLLKTAALVLAEKSALPEADPEEGARCVEEFGVVEPAASNMRLGSENGATEEGEEPGNVQTERKFSCSEEASVDVHSEDSEQRKDLKAVSIVDHALVLQESSDEFAGVAPEVETEPALAAKWSHEVSVDVSLPDDWVEVEMHSVAEPEASTAGRAPCDKPSPSGPVCVEPVNSSHTTERDAPSAIGVRELEKQSRELTSESLGIEEPTGTEREMASPSSTQSCFEERKSVHLPEQQLPDSVEWEANHSNGCETTSQELQQTLPVQVGRASENALPTSSQDEGVDFRLCCPLPSGEADESQGGEFGLPTQVERINVAESSLCTSESPVLADVELTCERAMDVDSTQGESHVKSTVRVPSFADWGRVIEVDDRTTDAVVEEVLESTSCAPPKQSEGIADIRKHVQRIWSLENLKRRPLVDEPRAVTEQAVRPVKPQTPKVVGLSWPPTPLTATEDKHYVDTIDALPSPRRRLAAECVGATDAIVAEPKEELPERPPSDQGFHGALEAHIKEQDPHILWSLKYLKTRPVMVEPRAETQPILKPVKLKAPKVVGLSWPPAPLTTAPGVNGVFT